MGSYIHRAEEAITLARSEDVDEIVSAAAALVSELGTSQSLDYLDYNCLAPLCFEHYSLVPDARQDPTFSEGLKLRAIDGIAREGVQRRSMQLVHDTLESANIPYAFFKGSATRLYLYDHPYQRPSADVDVLVSTYDRVKAIDVLIKAGLTPNLLEENLTHEITLMDGGTEIDLHWHVLRPGRLAGDLTTDLLDSRVLQGSLWCLSPHYGLLVQLVHPAYAKYVNAPWAKHIRLLDIERTLEHDDVDWDLLLRDLERLHAKTAAWSTLIWLQAVARTEIPHQVLQRLAPSKLKQSYLRRWILHGLVQQYYQRRLLMRLGLSLFLQDNLADAASAMRELWLSRSRTNQEIEKTRLAADQQSNPSNNSDRPQA